MQPVPQALAGQAKRSLQGLFLVVSDESACTTAVVEQLKQQGAQPAVLFTALLAERDRLTAKLAQLRAEYGSVQGIVNLAGLSQVPAAEDLAQWQQYSARHCRGLFSLVNLCAEEFHPAPEGRFILHATRFGGYFGRKAQENASDLGSYDLGAQPLAGAGVGLLKTLSKEWAGVTAKAVDFDASMTPSAIAQVVLQELQYPGRLEVGYPAGQRTVFKTVEAPLAPTVEPKLVPSADWVVLVTGGAKGVTAEVTADLAAAGLTLVLLGRSPLPAPETPATLGIEDPAQLRLKLLAMAKESGEKFTPVEIESRLRKLLGNRAMSCHLQQFQSLGATVDYRSVDVRDESAICDLMSDVYQRYGRLDAVIHGAGVIEDKLVINKSLESFDRVFETKLNSAYLLTRYLRPEGLKLLVFFASVAGRYGNTGQSDYAMANESLMRLAWQLDAQWLQTRVASVAWGPWDGGMASPQVKEKFRAQGIVPIPIENGRGFLQNEVAYGAKGITEVIAGEGPWEQHEAKAEAPAAQTATPVEGSVNNGSGAGNLLLIRQPIQYSEADNRWQSESLLSVESDRYLDHHRLDNQPVLPATVALEWLTEFVQTCCPDWHVNKVNDLRLLNGVTLTGDQPRAIQFSATVTEQTNAMCRVTAQIADPQTRRLHYRAVVELGRQFVPQGVTESLVPLGQSELMSGAEAYERYLFHGPCFQRLSRLKLSPLGIDAQLKISRPTDWGLAADGEWIFDPGVLDVGPQLAIIWLRHYRQTTALPTHLPVAIRHQSAPPPEVMQVYFRVMREDPYNLIYTVIFADAKGTPWYSLQNAQSVCSPNLNRLSD